MVLTSEGGEKTFGTSNIFQAINTNTGAKGQWLQSFNHLGSFNLILSHFVCHNKHPDRRGKEGEAERDGERRLPEPVSWGYAVAGIDPFLSVFLCCQSGEIKARRSQRSAACVPAREGAYEWISVKRVARGRGHGAWVVLRVDAFSAEPPDTKAKDHRHLHPRLSQKLKRIISFLQKETSFLLKYTRLKLKVIPG